VKYSFIDSIHSRVVLITNEDSYCVSFAAVIDNPDYDAFLTKAKLTDEEVHELTPDTWYNFPEVTE
jgi:hypothetical protein